MMLRTRALVLAMVVTAMLAACSGSTKHSTPSSTSAPTSTTTNTTSTTTAAPSSTTGSTTPSTTMLRPRPAPAPSIDDFSGPSSPIDCNAPTMIQLSWRTTNATTVELHIDGPVFATFTAGYKSSLQPFACDGRAHVYELVARNASARTATRTLTVTQRS